LDLTKGSKIYLKVYHNNEANTMASNPLIMTFSKDFLSIITMRIRNKYQAKKSWITPRHILHLIHTLKHFYNLYYKEFTNQLIRQWNNPKFKVIFITRSHMKHSYHMSKHCGQITIKFHTILTKSEMLIKESSHTFLSASSCNKISQIHQTTC
jgi:hypothetical protein